MRTAHPTASVRQEATGRLRAEGGLDLAYSTRLPWPLCLEWTEGKRVSREAVTVAHVGDDSGLD